MEGKLDEAAGPRGAQSVLGNESAPIGLSEAEALHELDQSSECQCADCNCPDGDCCTNY